MSESSVRKNLKARWDKIQSGIELDDEIMKKHQHLQYEKHKLSRDKLIFNTEKRQYLDTQFIKDSLLDKLEVLDFHEPTRYPTKDNDSIYHVFLSDIHIGKYDYAIHKDIFDNVVLKIHNEIPKGECVDLCFMGDIIEGLLRTSALRKIKIDLVEQVRWSYQLITYLLDSLVPDYIVGVKFLDEDNHGEIRPLGSQRNDFPEMNFNKFLSDYLEAYCEVNKVSFESNPIISIITGEQTYYLLHGHQFKSLKALREYYKNEYVIYGHFHNYNNNQKQIGLPAMVYSDEYTMFLGIPDSTPGIVISYNGFFKKVDIYESI